MDLIGTYILLVPELREAISPYMALGIPESGDPSAGKGAQVKYQGADETYKGGGK
jgi:hypothetical protein